MVIYDRRIEDAYELSCNCGKSLGVISFDEHKALLLGKDIEAIDKYHSTILCDKCKARLLTSMSYNNWRAMVGLAITENRILCGLPEFDIVPPESWLKKDVWVTLPYSKTLCDIAG